MKDTGSDGSIDTSMMDLFTYHWARHLITIMVQSTPSAHGCRIHSGNRDPRCVCVGVCRYTRVYIGAGGDMAATLLRSLVSWLSTKDGGRLDSGGEGLLGWSQWGREPWSSTREVSKGLCDPALLLSLVILYSEGIVMNAEIMSLIGFLNFQLLLFHGESDYGR